MQLCRLGLLSWVVLFAGCAPRPPVVDSNERQDEAKLESPATDDRSPTDLTPVRKSDSEWKKRLTPNQYRVARQKGTEPRYSGLYWNEKRPGQYLCVCCGLPLFSSAHKFESDTGWPSYYQPIRAGNVKTEDDDSMYISRVEVLCTRCDAHLGHVFDDSPRPTGLRYCMNSASLRFEPGSDDADGEGSQATPVTGDEPASSK